MTSTHIVAVTFKPKPEHLETFARAMQSVKTDLPTVSGCESVRVMKHRGDPSVFLLIEDWKNAELHAAHLARLAASGAWAELEQLLSEKPSSIVLSQV